VTLDVVFSEDPRDFLRRDWSELVRLDPAGTIFHTPDFLKLYWEEFGEEPDHLLLAFGEDAGTQVAAVAFERIDDTLRFLGGTEVTDYLGPVGRPEVTTAICVAFPRARHGSPRCGTPPRRTGSRSKRPRTRTGSHRSSSSLPRGTRTSSRSPRSSVTRSDGRRRSSRRKRDRSGSRPRRAGPCCRSSIGSWSCTG
jgi:hypothetical protein